MCHQKSEKSFRLKVGTYKKRSIMAFSNLQPRWSGSLVVISNIESPSNSKRVCWCGLLLCLNKRSAFQKLQILADRRATLQTKMSEQIEILIENVRKYTGFNLIVVSNTSKMMLGKNEKIIIIIIILKINPENCEKTWRKFSEKFCRNLTAIF